jgi:hypothetical protein
VELDPEPLEDEPLELDVPMSGQLPAFAPPDPGGGVDPDGGPDVPDGGVGAEPEPDDSPDEVPPVLDPLELVDPVLDVVEVELEAAVLALGLLLVLGVVLAEAPAAIMPIPRLRPSDPATTPAATRGRERFMWCSFRAVTGRLVRH